MSEPARQHRLTQIDELCLAAVCSECGPVRVYRRTGGGFMCAPAQRARMARLRGDAAFVLREALLQRPYLAHRGDACARCGRRSLFECALSVHHLDLDHKNNDPSNLETLCLTCHAEVHALHRIQDDVASPSASPPPAAVAA